MEFIKLESRGGNYLVVASNIAWLRTAENGQTTVGIVGGQPLLVVGSIEEVAATILAAAAQQKQAAPAPVVAEPAPAPAPIPAPAPEPVSAAPEPVPVAEGAQPMPAPQRLRASPVQSSTLADRLARAAAPTIKAGTQRLMTISEAS